MAIKINFDPTHNVQPPTYLLATRSGKKIGKLPAYNIVFRDALNSYSEICFRVNNAGCADKLWGKIKDFKLMFCPEYNRWFEIYVKTDEFDYLVKNISAKSLGEAELSQINLYGIEINTEADISRDDYKTTILFNKTDPKASLLNRILEKAPHYKIDHVDLSIANIQRTFSFDNISIYDALQKISQEINCLVDIKVFSDGDGNMCRNISVYDLESYCTECGHRDEFIGTCPKCGSKNILPGYGKDTTIFVSTRNLANNIQYYTNVDSVKNCFMLTAGDDLMTATIINCNPNGSGYIWYIPDYLKDDMSPELVKKINEYDKKYEYYQNLHNCNLPNDLLLQYNSLIDKYSKYSSDLKKIPNNVIGYPALMNAYYNTIDFALFLQSGLMPDVKMQSTDAAKEAKKLTSESLSPVSVQDIKKLSSATASSAVLAMAKVIVDSRYQVKIRESSLAGSSWIGTFIVTNYSDEEDTATGEQITVEINDDYERFVKQKIEKALSKASSDDKVDISELFKLDASQFVVELKRYSLSRLTSFHDACQSCIDILIEQGISDKETWADQNPNLYETIYNKYYERMRFLNEEISLRESEISIVIGSFDKDGNLTSAGLQTTIERERASIQEALNFQTYLGEPLWLEFSGYRREDTYQNDNFISDGLNNAELFDHALEFINVAKKDIVKSSTLQHSINATLNNLLVMKEFQPIVEYFEVGNWIRICVDNTIFKLRIIEYELDYDNVSSISIVFSDVKNNMTGISDVESIVQQASSMSSSYASVSRQANHGKKSSDQLDDWVDKGLALTKMKIVDNADNQNVTWDSHGLLCREYLPFTDLYDDRQLKIINRGLYLTNDNWRTSRAGIGNFAFYNPMTKKMEESYGVIADTLIGNLVLSKKVGIYTKDNSIVLDENGLVITTNEGNSSEPSKMAFTVQKNITDSSGQISTKKLMYLDDDGNLVLNGSIKINSSNSNIGSLDDLSNDDRINNIVNNINKPIYESLSSLSVNVDGIKASVTTIQSDFNNSIDDVNSNINVLTKKIEATMSSEDIRFEIKTQIQNGVDKVTTATGFKFNESGLLVSKSGQEMETRITENGMRITQSGTEVLIANNVGVDAKNLHATTYLIVGANSRFEDYGDRTACFWIGQ